VKDLQQLKMNGDQQLAQCIWAAVLQEHSTKKYYVESKPRN
jgi:hypothetical protein